MIRGLFVLLVFLLSCGSYCSVFSPCGAMSWSVVYDCGISWPCSHALNNPFSDNDNSTVVFLCFQSHTRLDTSLFIYFYLYVLLEDNTIFSCKLFLHIAICKYHNMHIDFQSIVEFLFRIPKIYCLFDLILYVPSSIFQLYRDGSSWVEPVIS